MARIDVYEQVTERIIAELEKGVVPWRRPWVGGGPVNVRSGRPYRGINIFLLEMRGYGDPRWGTFKAIKEAGGFVKKGEHGTPIILWKPVQKTREENGEAVDGSYLLLKSYTVFNVEQTEGLPPLVEKERTIEPLEAAQQIVDGYDGPPIHFGGGEAYYTLMGDSVHCPTMDQFHSAEGFYSTLYHELVHSTGHESRLKRDMAGFFASIPYSKEELVAEMGAAMLCGVAGIDNLDQSAAYVDNWLGRLRQDKKLVVQAAAQAQRAADFILGTTFEEKEEPELALTA